MHIHAMYLRQLRCGPFKTSVKKIRFATGALRVLSSLPPAMWFCIIYGLAIQKRSLAAYTINITKSFELRTRVLQ
jgi:hypothetical protein